MILRNQALYVLRNLEKFENSIKIHFFIREIAAAQARKSSYWLDVAYAFTITQSFKTA